MDKEILAKLSQSLAETKLDKVNPDKDVIEKVLTIQSHQLSSLSDSELSQNIYTLSQYLIFLTVQYNARNIKYLESKRTFEFALARDVSKRDEKTIKEKEAMARLNSEELQKLEKDLRLKEADYLLFDKIPESISELVNAFKKELGLRMPRNNRGPYSA
jgi:hypothetical protein